MTDNKQSTSLSAVDLVRQFVQLRDYAPDLESWSEEGFAANPPRLHRLRRLRALFAAYGIDWDPVRFARGAFLDSLNERYADLARQMGIPPGRKGVTPRSLDALGMCTRQLCFMTLLDYRGHIHKVLAHRKGILTGGGWIDVACNQMRELDEVIGEHLPLVEDLLAALISPEGRRFELHELVSDYGYPDVDLDEIDLDWI